MKRTITFPIIVLLLTTVAMAAGILPQKDGPEQSIEIRDQDISGCFSLSTTGGRSGGAIDFTMLWVLAGAFVTGRMLRRKG